MDRGDADYRLHVEVHPGAGPPILMVHGFLAGRALWIANLDALSAVATPVVVELYGHGRSPSPTDPAAYHPNTYVAAFEQIRRDLGVERWFVLGHSLGASLTLRYVFDHPDHVIAHVFTNSGSALAGPVWREQIVKDVDAQADRIIQHGVAQLERSSVNPARSHRNVPAVRKALAADAPLFQPLGIAATIRHTVPPSSVRDRVGGNTRPALLVAGEKERAFAEPSHYAERTMPQLAVVRLDAGHSPNAEVPNTFNETVTAFLTAALA
jgi:2-succinyl-6-hydroxy-2,4-cyclohexadiene-1-carboxylate synthase